MDKLRIKLMRKKPPITDYVRPELSKDVQLIFRASLKDACREQNKLLKKAQSISKSK